MKKIESFTGPSEPKHLRFGPYGPKFPNPFGVQDSFAHSIMANAS